VLVLSNNSVSFPWPNLPYYPVWRKYLSVSMYKGLEHSGFAFFHRLPLQNSHLCEISHAI
jgi:hypothetical protein